MVNAAHKLTVPWPESDEGKEKGTPRHRNRPRRSSLHYLLPCTLQAGPPREGQAPVKKLYCIRKLEGKRPLARDLRVDGILLLLLLLLLIIIVIITARSRVLLEKLTGRHVVKKFPRNRRVYDSVHKSPPLVRVLSQIHGPNATSWRSILILSPHLRLRLSSCPLQTSPPKPSIHLSSPLLFLMTTTTTKKAAIADNGLYFNYQFKCRRDAYVNEVGYYGN